MKSVLKWIAWFLVAVAIKAAFIGFAHRARADEYVAPPVGIMATHADGSWTDMEGGLHIPGNKAAQAKGWDGGELIQYPDGVTVARGFVVSNGKIIGYADYIDGQPIQVCKQAKFGNWNCVAP